MMTKTQYLLMKIAEEASEIAQIALKTAQFGLYEKHPDKEETNIERIESEYNDLLGVVNMLNDLSTESGGDYLIVMNPIAMAEKAKKVEKYMKYSQELGLVEGDHAKDKS